ncbi:MAG: ATP-binding protein, partial [Phycisphaerae bacterium]
PRGAIGSTIELPGIRGDGTEFPTELSLSVGTFQGKRFALAVIRDVTERKRTEEELREYSQRLAKLAEEQRVLLEHTRDFVYRHDVQGVFNYMSPAVSSITGYPVEDWLKHYTAYMTDNPINEKVIERTEETLRTGVEGPAYLVEIAHKNGHPITLEVNERPYHEHGRVAGLIGVARDVTERVRAQAEVEKAKEAAEAANKAKSIFLANMSHEIRTPITAMLGAAELLASQSAVAGRSDRADDTEPGTANREQKEDARHRSPVTDPQIMADVVLRNGRHLLVLIDDLLDVSQADAGKLEIQPRPCSLLDVIADVEAVTKPLHRRPDVDFRILAESKVPDPVITDPTRLKQAVINLVNNALKFTESGHVYVRVRVDASQPGPQLVIKVEDTGPGVSREDAKRIFEPFTQVGSGRMRPTEGVGLGLPLARWIARQLGGDIEIDLSSDRGTTFVLRVDTGPTESATWIALPETVVPADGVTRRSRDRGGEVLSGRILLAEDFADTRKLVAQALSEHGATVTSVSNGKEAVDAALATPYDLIILDVRMPEKDGPTAVAELRKAGCLVPIIALTALATKPDLEGVLDAGFDDVWTKPIALDKLVEDAAAFVGTVMPSWREQGTENEDRTEHAVSGSPVSDPDPQGTQKPAALERAPTVDFGRSSVEAPQPSSEPKAGSTECAQNRPIPARRDSTPHGISPRLHAVRLEFVRGLPARVRTIEQALEDGDPDAGRKRAREILHQLVGAGGMHGFMPISEEAARLQKLADAAQLAARPEQLAVLWDLVRDALRQMPDDIEGTD